MDRRFQYSEDSQNQGLDLGGVILLLNSSMTKPRKGSDQCRPPDKSVHLNFFFISHSIHMLWVLKRIVINLITLNETVLLSTQITCFN